MPCSCFPCRRLLLLPFTLLMLPILLPLWGLNALWKAFVFFIELPFLPVLIPYRYGACAVQLRPTTTTQALPGASACHSKRMPYARAAR